MNTRQSVATNGYSNKFTLWGGEDDDLSFRVRFGANLKILRPAACKFARTSTPDCMDQTGPITGYMRRTFKETATRGASGAIISAGEQTEKR